LPLHASLTHLDVSHNPIGVDGAKALADALAPAPASSLSTVSLDGAPLPVRPLRGTEAVRTLRLDKRHLGPLSAVFLAGLVRVNPTLTALSLAENALGPSGAAAVVSAMRGNRCVTLDLCSNDLGAAGAKAVGTQLAEAPSSLTSLNLDGFALPVRKLRGGIAISCLLVKNGHLTAINLAGNALGVLGATAIAAATAANTTLQHVDVRNNKLDADAKAQVRAVAPLAVSGRLLVSTPDSDRGDDAAAADGGRPTKAGAATGKSARTSKAGSSINLVSGNKPTPNASAAAAPAVRTTGGRKSVRK